MPPAEWPTRILVVGGAGSFGRRLVQGLVATTGYEVVVAGRSLDRAASLAATLAPADQAGRIRAAAIDIAHVDAAMLVRIGADIVVDAAGPFQGGSYRLAEAAIETGLHYVDLADARAFVAGFPALDVAARGRGVVALTGASSTSALSNAALDRLTAGWRRVEVEIRVHRIRTAIRTGGQEPLFTHVLGTALTRLPKPVRDAHAVGDGLVLSGQAEVTRGRGVVVAIVAALIGLPSAGRAVPVIVRMERRGRVEVWTRCFAGRTFRSTLSAGSGPGCLRERFGPLTFDLAVQADETGLTMAVAGWHLGPIRLPLSLAPLTRAHETVDPEGRFRFDVALDLPLFGFLIRYAGWLVPPGLLEM